MTNTLDSFQDYVIVCPHCERQRTIETTRNGVDWVVICTQCGFEEEHEQGKDHD